MNKIGTRPVMTLEVASGDLESQLYKPVIFGLGITEIVRKSFVKEEAESFAKSLAVKRGIEYIPFRGRFLSVGLVEGEYRLAVVAPYSEKGFIFTNRIYPNFFEAHFRADKLGKKMGIPVEAHFFINDIK